MLGSGAMTKLPVQKKAAYVHRLFEFNSYT
jgi:hypothetical protein